MSGRFLHQAHNLLFPRLLSLASNLSTHQQNVQAYYVLMCLLVMEVGTAGVEEMLLVMEQVQVVAVSEGTLPFSLRVALHCTVAGVLHLISLVTDNSSLNTHVNEIAALRRQRCPHLLPDSLFQHTDNCGDDEEAEISAEALFQLRERGFVQSISLQRNSSAQNLSLSLSTFSACLTAAGLFKEHSHFTESVRSFRAVSMDHSCEKVSLTLLLSSLFSLPFSLP